MTSDFIFLEEASQQYDNEKLCFLLETQPRLCAKSPLEEVSKRYLRHAVYTLYIYLNKAVTNKNEIPLETGSLE